MPPRATEPSSSGPAEMPPGRYGSIFTIRRNPKTRSTLTIVSNAGPLSQRKAQYTVVLSTFAARATLAIPPATTAASTALQIERKSLVANAAARAAWLVRLDDAVKGIGVNMYMLTMGAPTSVAAIGLVRKVSASRSNVARPMHIAGRGHGQGVAPRASCMRRDLLAVPRTSSQEILRTPPAFLDRRIPTP